MNSIESRNKAFLSNLSNQYENNRKYYVSRNSSIFFFILLVISRYFTKDLYIGAVILTFFLIALINFYVVHKSYQNKKSQKFAPLKTIEEIPKPTPKPYTSPVPPQGPSITNNSFGTKDTRLPPLRSSSFEPVNSPIGQSFLNRSPYQGKSTASTGFNTSTTNSMFQSPSQNQTQNFNYQRDFNSYEESKTFASPISQPVQYNISPLNVKSTPTTGQRSRDALQALNITQIPDEWIDKLSTLLCNHLQAIMKIYQESTNEFQKLLEYAAKVPKEQGGISASDSLKAIKLLEYKSELQKEILENGVTITLTDVVKYCQSIGASLELINRFEIASSFFKICYSMMEIKSQNQENFNTPSESNQWSGFPDLIIKHSLNPSNAPFRSPISESIKSPVFVDRLRELLYDSSDKKLRIRWSHSSGRQISSILQPPEETFSDQEIAIALFFHLCDNLSGKTTPSSSNLQKFWTSHYALGMNDIYKIFKDLEQISSFDSKIPFLTFLFKTSKPGDRIPHYDIMRVSSKGNTRELLTIDPGRNDCFESILIFLIRMYLDYDVLELHDDNNQSSSKNNKDNTLVDWTSNADYRVIKKLTEDVIGIKDLKLLFDSNYQSNNSSYGGSSPRSNRSPLRNFYSS